MISIKKATENDYEPIVRIGKLSVTAAHKESCLTEILAEFVDKNYNAETIKKEIADQHNIYHILFYNNQPVGFSKIIFNAKHANINRENVTKLDRIYLLRDFHGKKFGSALLNFNIELAGKSGQTGMWLYTWIGNKKAIEFYQKAGFSIIGKHDFHVAQNHYNPNYQMFLDFAAPDNIRGDDDDTDTE